MDYVREELLRQKRALEALLGGGEKEGREERDEPQTERLANGTEAAGRRLRHTPAGEKAHEAVPVKAGSVRAIRSVRSEPAQAVEETLWLRSGSAASAGMAEVRAQQDARLMSRAIQRDARRYDGGFTMY